MTDRHDLVEGQAGPVKRGELGQGCDPGLVLEPLLAQLGEHTHLAVGVEVVVHQAGKGGSSFDTAIPKGSMDSGDFRVTRPALG